MPNEMYLTQKHPIRDILLRHPYVEAVSSLLSKNCPFRLNVSAQLLQVQLLLVSQVGCSKYLRRKLGTYHVGIDPWVDRFGYSTCIVPQKTNKNKPQA